MWRLSLLLAACGRIGFDPLDVPPPCAPTPGLVACWEFEQTTSDTSGKGNDLVGSNVRYAPGQAGLGTRVDASSDLRIDDNPTLTGATQLSVEAWILPASVPDPGVRAGILDKSGQFAIFVNPDATVTCVIGIGGILSLVSTGLVPVAGTSHHVACVFDGTTVIAYLDGNVANTMSHPGVLDHFTTPLVVGHNEPMGEPFDGVIDSVRIWNRALPASEICIDSGTCP